jgi:kinesin family protein 18/19
MEPTAANVTSSRSHAVLLVTVRQYSQDESEVTDGKLYLIDLAGSERASQTKVKARQKTLIYSQSSP